MTEKTNPEPHWYHQAPGWEEIVPKDKKAPHPPTAPVHIVKPETSAIAKVITAGAKTKPRHTRRPMIVTDPK